MLHIALLSTGFSAHAPPRTRLAHSNVARTASTAMKKNDAEVEARFRAMEAQPTKSNSGITVLMEKYGAPNGLMQRFYESTEHFTWRCVVVDNSGSMGRGDGQKLGVDWTGRTKVIDCTRWQELTEELKAIAEISNAIGATTEFYPINPTNTPPVVISGESSGHEVSSVCKNLAPPNNGTPLAEATERIVDKVRSLESGLRKSGKKACVVIATDGCPTDGEGRFKRAIEELQTLPVWLVFRLCTNDEVVIGYYNELDAQLEGGVEVLDDVRGEAKEIAAAGNGWLTYALPLHLAREFGMRDQLFDFLDQEKLVPSQIKDFCEALLGVTDLPDPDLNPPAFLTALDEELTQHPKVFDPITEKMSPWINTRMLKTRLF